MLCARCGGSDTAVYSEKGGEITSVVSLVLDMGCVNANWYVPIDFVFGVVNV